MSNFADWPKMGRLGVFRISVSTLWLAESKCTDTDLKNSQICSILDQSDAIGMLNLTSMLFGVPIKDVRVAPKLNQIGPKLEKKPRKFII